MVWEGKGVVGAGRKLLGATNPLASDPSTIRGAYGVDVGRNVCHGSDEEPGSAAREIKLWYVDSRNFRPECLLDFSSGHPFLTNVCCVLITAGLTRANCANGRRLRRSGCTKIKTCVDVLHALSLPSPVA